MAVELLERPTQPKLAESGNGAIPPELPRTAVAAPLPPERESFNPDQAQLKAETEAQFSAITSQLGDVATKGAEIIHQDVK